MLCICEIKITLNKVRKDATSNKLTAVGLMDILFKMGFTTSLMKRLKLSKQYFFVYLISYSRALTVRESLETRNIVTIISLPE